MEIMKNAEGGFVFIRDVHTTNRTAVTRHRIKITHQVQFMALCTAKGDPIIRVRRNLIEYNGGGLCILHESRLEIALLLKALGVSAVKIGDLNPIIERSWDDV